jgi:hypothetical protein
LLALLLALFLLSFDDPVTALFAENRSSENSLVPCFQTRNALATNSNRERTDT